MGTFGKCWKNLIPISMAMPKLLFIHFLIRRNGIAWHLGGHSDSFSVDYYFCLQQFVKFCVVLAQSLDMEDGVKGQLGCQTFAHCLQNNKTKITINVQNDNYDSVVIQNMRRKYIIVGKMWEPKHRVEIWQELQCRNLH